MPPWPLPGEPLGLGLPCWPFPCCPLPCWPVWPGCPPCCPPALARSRRASCRPEAAVARSRLTCTRVSAPWRASPSRSSAALAPALSPWDRLATASRRAWPAAPSAWLAWPWSSASSRASASRSAWVMSSTLSPASSRSSLAFFGSPPGFACGFPVDVRERARERAAIDAAFCSLAGSSCARTSSSTEPSWARFLSRSPGLSRSRSASARNSSARSVRGSPALAPLPSRSLAISSMRSAWRSASSRTSRFCAITRSIGFGRRIAGSTSAVAMSAASAGRRATRGRNRPGSIARRRPSASRRWRRTKRASASAMSNAPSTAIESSSEPSAGPAAAGMAPAKARAEATASPAPPSASTARAVSPSVGRTRTTRTRRTSAPTTGMATAMSGACSMGSSRWAIASRSSATATAAATYHARRTDRRSHSRRRCVARPARISVRAGSSAMPSDAGSAGT